MTSTNKLQLNENNNIVYSEYLVKNKIPSAKAGLSESNKLLIDCFKFFKKVIKKNVHMRARAINHINFY